MLREIGRPPRSVVYLDFSFFSFFFFLAPKGIKSLHTYSQKFVAKHKPQSGAGGGVNGQILPGGGDCDFPRELGLSAS